MQNPYETLFTGEPGNPYSQPEQDRYIPPYAFEYESRLYNNLLDHFKDVFYTNVAPWKNPKQVHPDYGKEEGIYNALPDPVLSTYGGEKAKGFANALNKFIGKYDKKPRFEIDDSAASLAPKWQDIIENKARQTSFVDGKVVRPETKLSEIFDHPELYEQYPELRNVTVKTRRTSDYDAGYNPADNSINIGIHSNSGVYPKDTILHEIQHAIQEYEGFAKGGMTKGFDELPLTVKEAVIGADIGDITHPNEWKQIFGPENPLGIAISAKELAGNGLLSKLELAQLEKSAEKHGFKSFDEMADYLKAQADFRSPEGQYQRLAGEIEARDVAARANLTPEQRLATEPYSSENIPVENAIVRFR